MLLGFNDLLSVLIVVSLLCFGFWFDFGYFCTFALLLSVILIWFGLIGCAVWGWIAIVG